MSICTTRTLEGMYIFSNPPKAVAAPISLKQAGKSQNFKNYRNSTIANNYRSIYSPNHFITGRPLSGYWWREKKETYEQQSKATPLGTPTQKYKREEDAKVGDTHIEKEIQDAVCQTDEVQDLVAARVHTSSQTTPISNQESISQVKTEPFKISECRLTSQQLLAQAEEASKDSEIVPLEIVSRVLSHTYVEDMVPSILHKLKEHGYADDIESAENEDNSVLPWLMNELELGLSRLETSYQLLSETSREGSPRRRRWSR